VEGAEAGHAERELAPVLVPGAGQREGDEAAEEGDVGRAAVGQQVERAEEGDRHDEGVARDAVHASRGRIAGHDPGRARADGALPWLLAGVVLAGCARTGPGLPVTTAPDALVDLRALDPSIRIEMPTPRRTTSPAWLSTPSHAASSVATWRSGSYASSGASAPRGSGSWCGIATVRSGCSSVCGRSCPTRATSPSRSSATAGRWRARSTTAARPWT